MKIRMGIVCLLSFFTIAPFSTAADDKAALKTILQELNSFSASFEQSIVDAQGQELQNSKGALVLGKPYKLRWEVSFPDESLLIADGKAVYNIDPFVEQVTIFNQQDVIQNNPLSLLMSNDEAAWQGINVVKDGETFILNVDDPQASILSLLLVFDDMERLQSLTAIDSQQQQNQIRFNDIKVNPMLSLNLFTPSIGDNYEIDDQR